MKNIVDTNFARTLLILVGALIIFSFWFLTEDMRNDFDKTPVTAIPHKEMDDTQNLVTQETVIDQEEIGDPVLKEAVIGNIDVEEIGEIDELGELTEIGSIDFADIDF